MPSGRPVPTARGQPAGQRAPVPPRGIAIPDADRAELQPGVDELGRQIDALRESLRRKPDLLRLLPDVQVYHKAVRDALEYDEFYKPAEVAVAKDLLKRGLERAGQLREGQAPWDTGHRAWSCAATSRRSTARCSRTAWSCRRRTGRIRRIAIRLDVWCHGRGEKLTRAELHRRPAEVARRVHAAATPSCCIPTADTATPTSSPARSTASRRSTTSRSTTRSTRTAW